MTATEVLSPEAFRLTVVVAVVPLPGPAGIATRAGAERAVQSVLGPIEMGRDPISTEIVIAAEGAAAETLRDAFRDSLRGRVTVVPVARTGSRARAWNEGAKMARGHFLAFVDPSAWWQPTRLAELEPWLRRHDLILQASEDIPPSSADWVRTFVLGNPATRGSGVIRRELFEELGGFSSVPGAEEQELWLRALALLAKREARDRFALIASRTVVAEADVMEQALPGMAKRLQALKDAVTLLTAVRGLPKRYWTSIAKAVWERGRAVTKK